MIEAGKNNGVIPVDPKPGEFDMRGETAVVGLDNTISDWTPFLPTGEWQEDTASNPVFETDACVSFSADQTLQTYGDFCVAMDLWSADAVAWLKANGYFDANGKLNFSDRFTAKMSGTTQAEGNSLPNVWGSIQENGLVPETLWPFPMAEINADPENAWNIYYSTIPANVIALGLEFKARFTCNWDWVTYPADPMTEAQLKAALVTGPIQIATAVCPPWNTAAPIQGCGAGAQHATMLYAIGADYQIFDHYVPFQKLLAPNYNITYATRATLTPVSTEAPAPFTYTFNKQLTAGSTSNDPVELENLQAALQYLGFMQKGVYGPFGPITQTALAKFQVAHGITDPTPGADFGPQGWAAMNKALGVTS